MNCKEFNFNRKSIKKMEPPKMTSKVVQELLIKRYDILHFFPLFHSRKKQTNFSRKLSITIFFLLKTLECTKLNFNNEEI